MKKKTAYTLSLILFLCFIGFTYLVKIVDVGVSLMVPETDIGFSSLNNAFHTLTGVNLALYKLTNYMGIASIGFGLCFGAYGAYQLIKRKSFFEIDRDIYALGIIYAILGIFYVIFEKVAINYRPILMDGEIEASYPSSHTFLICVIIATAIIEINKIFDNKKLIITLSAIGYVYILVGIVGRLLCGAHWLTDIFASLILSASVIFFFCAISKTEKGKHSVK